MKALQETVRLF